MAPFPVDQAAKCRGRWPRLQDRLGAGGTPALQGWRVGALHHEFCKRLKRGKMMNPRRDPKGLEKTRKGSMKGHEGH